MDMARTAMQDFQQGMIAQRTKTAQQQSQASSLALEDQRTATANAHDRSMQMDKLTATVNLT